LGLALSVGSSALNGLLAWLMFRAAKQHRSLALEADARHLVTDVWTSAGVVIGIGLVGVTGWLWLDAVVAIAVALNILKEGWHLIWLSSQGLMDAARPRSSVLTTYTPAKRGNAVLWMCTCTCLPAGPWGGQLPCVAVSSKP
jgi:cation diffusion facilitator family transporter